ncbi:hypothetical protein CWE13_03910 [Aliidiomarina shirensis]|uniref:Uncharacterized protein n=1 Tax=Aliidiomarina shirensis TaxID=1048642 RepID=A0A432WYG4_9GAMM|nr:hypothetical protein [Aliidiomarina shirensis]RUO38786.1 hypothetical protein CWE13_03910 [Aliidiomarina shirensis]
MKWNSLSATIGALLMLVSAITEEPDVIEPILNKDEVNQHKQLALSLRNQRLLEQKAESRAKQLLFQLQAAEAWAAIQRLGGQVSGAHADEADAADNSNLYVADVNEFYGFRALAIIKRGENWIARIGDNQRVITVKNGSELKPGVRVRIEKDLVELTGKGWKHQISME